MEFPNFIVWFKLPSYEFRVYDFKNNELTTEDLLSNQSNDCNNSLESRISFLSLINCLAYNIKFSSFRLLTSFVINSSSGTDTGTVNWWIIN